MEKNSVGIVIATYNRKQELRECLSYIFKLKLPPTYICIVDDESTDGTWEMLSREYPDIFRIRGDGNLWWAGATNKGIEFCLQNGCEYILLLNPDTLLLPDTFSHLIKNSQLHGNAITTSVVLFYDDSNTVWWAGSRWGPLKPWLPIWCNRYLYKSGVRLDKLPEKSYRTDEAHGRGVLIPREIFNTIGLYDEIKFPQYGADIDFSFRAKRAGFSIFVVPKAKVKLFTDSTGMKTPKAFYKAIRGYGKYLINRKNGEALRVWWNLLVRYVPFYAVLPSYVFIITLNTFRYWQRFFHQKRTIVKFK
jgi:GT2 family glycosyltransferase